MTAEEYFYIVCEKHGINKYVNSVYDCMMENIDYVKYGNGCVFIFSFLEKLDHKLLYNKDYENLYGFLVKRFFQDGFILIKERNHEKDKNPSNPIYSTQPDYLFYLDIYNEKREKHKLIANEYNLHKI